MPARWAIACAAGIRIASAVSDQMTEKGKTKFNPMAMAVNSIAIALTLSAFMGDSSAFLGWLYLGVLDGHWNDITLQILLVCLVVSFASFLLVAAFFGLGIRLA